MMIESSLHRPQQQRTAGYGICATREIGEWLTKPKHRRGLPLEARLQVPEEPAERCGRDHVRRHAQPEREGPDELRVAPTLVCTAHGSRRGRRAARAAHLQASDLRKRLEHEAREKGKGEAGASASRLASFAEVAASDPTHALMVKTGQGRGKRSASQWREAREARKGGGGDVQKAAPAADREGLSLAHRRYARAHRAPSASLTELG